MDKETKKQPTTLGDSFRLMSEVMKATHSQDTAVPRPQLVKRGRQLAQDEDYPRRTVIDTVARNLLS